MERRTDRQKNKTDGHLKIHPCPTGILARKVMQNWFSEGQTKTSRQDQNHISSLSVYVKDRCLPFGKSTPLKGFGRCTVMIGTPPDGVSKSISLLIIGPKSLKRPWRKSFPLWKSMTGSISLRHLTMEPIVECDVIKILSHTSKDFGKYHVMRLCMVFINTMEEFGKIGTTRTSLSILWDMLRASKALGKKRL